MAFPIGAVWMFSVELVPDLYGVLNVVPGTAEAGVLYFSVSSAFM